MGYLPNRPKFVTFTGADRLEHLDGMRELSSKYPIEWGILFSPDRQGTPRYPAADFIEAVQEIHDPNFHLSAHICGNYSKLILSGKDPVIPSILPHGFRRMQINTAAKLVPEDLLTVFSWVTRYAAIPILQCRYAFPVRPILGPTDSYLDAIRWLYDKSGGRGTYENKWPVADVNRLCGYAGGIRPTNVREVVESIGYCNFWLDMETGVRNDKDEFDLELCRQVCVELWGDGVQYL